MSIVLNITKLNAIEKFEQQVKICSLCELSTTRTNVVPGEGNFNAEVVLIGEGPGKNEDEQGRPFVGAAGNFLNEMIAAAKMKREDVYIANVVKCRPPGNRDPFPNEKTACKNWLNQQISIIQPKVLVLLGKHSLNEFLPSTRISEVHGRVLRKEFPPFGKIVFFPCYHPAAALYNGGLRETLLKDFAKIPKLLEILKKEEV